MVPLQATLNSSGLRLDVKTANGYVGRWLTQVANARVHGTTGEVPNHRLQHEQAQLLPLPMSIGNRYNAASSMARPMPMESLQHPLSLYDQMLGGLHEFAV